MRCQRGQQQLRSLHQSVMTEGFALPELMIIIAILGIVSGIVVNSPRIFLARDHANAAAADLLGWMEAISARSIEFGPCTVSFTTGTNLQPGSTVARLASGDVRCTPEATLRLPSGGGRGNFSVATSLSPNNASTIVFTPRGGAASAGGDSVIKISFGNSAPLRCVRVSFAAFSIGRNNSTSDVSQTCSEWDRT